MINLLRKSDFISQEPKLFINSRNRFKSILGLSITMIIILLTTFFSFYLLIDHFRKRKIKIIYNEDVNENPKLEARDLPFMFALLDSNGNLYENPERLYYFSAMHWKISPNVSSTTPNPIFSSLNFTKCNETTFELKYADLKGFSTLKHITNCINTNFNLTLQGLIGDANQDNFFFSLKVKKCTNTTQNNKNPCYPKDTIDYLLARSSLLLYFIDFNVNNENIYKPNIPYFKAFMIPSNSYLAKQIKYYFSNVEYEFDDGLFFENKQTYNFFQQKEVDTDYSILDPGVSTILNIVFTMSRIKAFYSISYDKIVTLLANIGAIWNILLYLGVYINKYFMNELFYMYISRYNKIVDDKCEIINPNNDTKFNWIHKNKLMKLKSNFSRCEVQSHSNFDNEKAKISTKVISKAKTSTKNLKNLTSLNQSNLNSSKNNNNLNNCNHNNNVNSSFMDNSNFPLQNLCSNKKLLILKDNNNMSSLINSKNQEKKESKILRNYNSLNIRSNNLDNKKNKMSNFGNKHIHSQEQQQNKKLNNTNINNNFDIIPRGLLISQPNSYKATNSKYLQTKISDENFYETKKISLETIIQNPNYDSEGKKYKNNNNIKNNKKNPLFNKTHKKILNSYNKLNSIYNMSSTNNNINNSINNIDVLDQIQTKTNRSQINKNNSILKFNNKNIINISNFNYNKNKKDFTYYYYNNNNINNNIANKVRNNNNSNLEHVSQCNSNKKPNTHFSIITSNAINNENLYQTLEAKLKENPQMIQKEKNDGKSFSWTNHMNPSYTPYYGNGYDNDYLGCKAHAKDKSLFKKEDLRNATNSKISKGIAFDHKKTNNDIFKIENFFKKDKKQKSSSASCNSLFNCKCKGKRVNKSLKRMLMSYIKKKLSIEELLRKIIEIDKIKFLIFDKNNLRYFNCLPTRFYFENLNPIDFSNGKTGFANQLELCSSIIKKDFKDNINYGLRGYSNKSHLELREFWGSNEFD